MIFGWIAALTHFIFHLGRRDDVASSTGSAIAQIKSVYNIVNNRVTMSVIKSVQRGAVPIGGTAGNTVNISLSPVVTPSKCLVNIAGGWSRLDTGNNTVMMTIYVSNLTSTTLSVALNDPPSAAMGGRNMSYEVIEYY